MATPASTDNMDTDAAAAKLPGGGGDAPGTGPASTQPMGSAGEGGSGLGIAGLGPLKDLEQGVKPSDIHVLLVDDEKVSRLVVAKQLTRAGYTVTLAENGAQALEFLRKHPDRYSLILSDVMMPEVNGLELLKAVRSERALASIPMVMMSSHEQAALVFECVRRGAEDYVLKPISTKEVLYLWQHVYRRQFAWKRLSGAEDEEDDEDPNDGSVYTVDEMKAHCLRQIERYQKVLKVIEQYPEAFPTVHDS